MGMWLSLGNNDAGDVLLIPVDTVNSVRVVTHDGEIVRLILDNGEAQTYALWDRGVIQGVIEVLGIGEALGVKTPTHDTGQGQTCSCGCGMGKVSDLVAEDRQIQTREDARRYRALKFMMGLNSSPLIIRQEEGLVSIWKTNEDRVSGVNLDNALDNIKGAV